MNLDLQLLIGIGPDGTVRQDARTTGVVRFETHVAPLGLSGIWLSRVLYTCRTSGANKA